MTTDTLKTYRTCCMNSYEKALTMAPCKIPWETGFNWPDYSGIGPSEPETCITCMVVSEN